VPHDRPKPTTPSARAICSFINQSNLLRERGPLGRAPALARAFDPSESVVV
jgi:hypothetical protein